MRSAFENRNALLGRGISADRVAPRTTENYRGLRKNCTRRKRHLGVGDREADQACRGCTEKFQYRLPSPKVIVRSPFLPLPTTVSEGTTVLSSSTSIGGYRQIAPFKQRGNYRIVLILVTKGVFRATEVFFEVNEVFPRLLKFFGFAELPKFSKIFGVAEVLLFLPFSPVPLVSPKLPNLPNSACSGPRKIPASVSCNNRHAARTQIDHPPSGVDTSPRVHEQKRERFPTFLIKERDINFHSNLFFF
jgi:hypothetical protein